MSLSLWTPSQHNLSFTKTLASQTPLFLHTKPTHLSLPLTHKTTSIRMGGGPRTYPGGVSKWQWKRMQAKKAKQLLKARLARERQVYEMRKRAELKAAVAELERPWEPVDKPPRLFSVSADEQVKVLADRFQKPGGIDLWSDRDGPQLFRNFGDGDENLPSARFFPKGVVHSVRPYKRGNGLDEFEGESDGRGSRAENVKLTGNVEGNARADGGGKWGRKGSRRRGRLVNGNGSSGVGSGNFGFSGNDRESRPIIGGKQGENRPIFGGKQRDIRPIKQRVKSPVSRGSRKQVDRRDGFKRSNYSESEVYDLNLGQDGSYGYQAESGEAEAGI